MLRYKRAAGCTIDAVSRGCDCVQESRVVRIIRKQLVKRCLDMMTDLMGKGEDEYEKFWSQFGRNIKLGIVDDPENKDKLASLLRVCPRLHGRPRLKSASFASALHAHQTALHPSWELCSATSFAGLSHALAYAYRALHAFCCITHKGVAGSVVTSG